jgi:tetratricopeptide (TPR) repeat protein
MCRLFQGASPSAPQPDFVPRLKAACVPMLSAMLVAIVMQSSAHAQIDRVYPASGNPISGKITDIKRDSVTIESSSKSQTVPAAEIQKIMFDGDPTELTKGREFALDGQWEQALDELKRLNFAKVNREYIKADAMYYLARSESQLALVGRGNSAEAVKKMRAFAAAYPDSIHFYGAAKSLGDLAVSMGSFDQATTFYGALTKSPSPDLQIESKYLTGLSRLRQGKAAEAQADFDAVIANKNVNTTTAARIQTLAQAGKAVSLSQQGKGAEGLAIVDDLISKLNTSDSEMAARIYNAQGASLEATGDSLGAVMAYLHTHLMFSGQADAHAESLSKLVQLWPKVGKPERAAEARDELQQRYPGWGK